jgi:chorismate-pyruvate lyase
MSPPLTSREYRLPARHSPMMNRRFAPNTLRDSFNET